MQRKLHAPIGHDTRIDQRTGIARCGRDREGDDLIPRLTIVIGQVEAQTVLQEGGLQTQLPRIGRFGFQIGIGQLLLQEVAGQGTDVGILAVGGQEAIGIGVATHLGPARTQLAETQPRHPLPQQVAPEEAGGDRGIDVGIVILGQGARLVVTQGRL